MALKRIQKELVDFNKDPLQTAQPVLLMIPTFSIDKQLSWDIKIHLSKEEFSFWTYISLLIIPSNPQSLPSPTEFTIQISIAMIQFA